jgi:hypothetical protein
VKRLFVILLFLTFVIKASTQIQGSYAVDYGKQAEGPYKLLKIHTKGNGTLLFYFEGGLGAPSYNSGALYGNLNYNTKTGHYEYLSKNNTNGCKLVFTKSGKFITIKRVAGDCQFGYGVEADGKYLVIDHNNPKLFVDRKGRKIYFDKTAPGYLF